jgi:hypothetical protein
MGSLVSAGAYLEKASAIYKTCASNPLTVLETHINLNRGLLCFSNDQVF